MLRSEHARTSRPRADLHGASSLSITATGSMSRPVAFYIDARGGAVLHVDVQLLLVEDTKRLALSLAKGLREEGLDVRTAASGMAALRELESAPPDVVILDLGLPDLDGMEVLEWPSPC